MARYWTYYEILTKVKNDLDLENETMFSAEEMLGYCNEAIDEAEAEIHTLYEDYFLTNSVISLVNGTSEYSLPTDIYAMKIRDIIYSNGGNVWRLKKYRDWKKIQNYSEDKEFSSGQVTDYFIKNSTAGDPHIVLIPPNTEAGNLLTVWYIRNANRMTVDASVCDIPEFVSFVIAFIKYKCAQKELHPSMGNFVQDLEQQRAQMNATLSGMIPDSDNEIEADYSHYKEHV